MSDDDGFSSLSWPECTEEDLQEIDRLCEEGRQNGMAMASDHGAPSILIELEEAADGYYKSGEGAIAVDKSPYDLFRARRGCLSVTDIVAPAWCEVQFDYGLRQDRRKPLSARPQTFTTAKGKEITVKAQVAERNEQVLDKGRTVHKKLEREVHKEEVPVEVKTKEEHWALRLLDLLARLKASTITSVCREVPVWGIIHDHAIVGIIDELRLESKKPADEPNTREDRQAQTNLNSFIINAKPLTSANPQYSLRIIDNKTRPSPYLPSEADTFPSRLQLMLYWLLLSQALIPSTNAPSYSAFCARIGLDPKQPFSDTFTHEMALITMENDFSLHFLDAKCLEDMDYAYRESVKDMGLDVEGSISRRLSLVYRLRGRQNKRLKPTSRSGSGETTPARQSDEQGKKVVKDIAEELAVSSDEGNVKLVAPMDGTAEVVSDADAAASSSRKRKRRESSTSSTETAPTDSSTAEEASASSNSESETGQSPFILGTRYFSYNARLLEAHVSSVLAWWHGLRPAQGVSIEEVNRCNSCEYKNGCEWREQKALEALEKAKAKSKLVQNDDTP